MSISVEPYDLINESQNQIEKCHADVLKEENLFKRPFKCTLNAIIILFNHLDSGNLSMRAFYRRVSLVTFYGHIYQCKGLINAETKQEGIISATSIRFDKNEEFYFPR